MSAIADKFGLGRRGSVLLVGGGTALVSFLYATAGGLNLLDVVDNFVNLFGIAVVGLVEVIVVAWVVRHLPTLRAHADLTSDVQLRGWWTACLMAITPGLLLVVTIDNLRRELAEPYGTVDSDYPVSFVVTYGWGAAALALLIGVVLTVPRWRRDTTLTLDDLEVRT